MIRASEPLLRYTTLYYACFEEDGILVISIIRLLPQAGASPTLVNNCEQRPLGRFGLDHPARHAAISLFADAEKAHFLLLARSIVVAANINAPEPSFLRRRISEGQPLPSVVLAPVPATNDEEARKFRELSTTHDAPAQYGAYQHTAGIIPESN